MEEELDQLKSVLRSLVVSSPTQVDARSLLRDYRSMVGSQLPFAKFGYRDPIAFLRERCSDCFLGSPANPDLTLIVPDALKHVDKFVQKQKVSFSNSAAKYKGKRRSVLASTVMPSPDLIASTFSNRWSMPNRRVPEIARKDQQYTNCTQSTKVKENTTVNNDTAGHNGTQHAQSQVNSRTTARLSQERPHERREPTREDDDSGRLTASSSSSGRRRLQLEKLKRELRDLVVEHPDGVYCTDLIRLYRQRHSCELNFSRFGFTSVLSLASSVEGVRVTHDAAQGDWILNDAARAPPALRPTPHAAPCVTPRARPAADPEDALPGIPYAPDVFPPDCMGLLDSIPALSLVGISPGDQLEVSVGEVYSPSHFWLQRLGDEYNIAMETVMDEMNVYYSSEEGRSRRLLPGAVRVGFYCSSCYDGDWHRSLIVHILDADTVKVRYVDYGTVERCAVSALRPLRREWGALPAQALRGRLARVSPPAAARRWPRAASLYFLQLVCDRGLVATVSAADPQEDVLEVFLTYTSTDENLCITGELVRAGHADARRDPALGTSECYLFPRFSALESGATPSFAEMHAFLRDGIALEFVDEYGEHVPPSLPPAREPAALGPQPPTDDTSSSDEDGATPSPARRNRVPHFPTQHNDPAHARRNIRVCATAPQPAQQCTPQLAPQHATRYYMPHTAASVPNPPYAPLVPNLSYSTRTTDNYSRRSVQAATAPPNDLVYLTRSEAVAAYAMSRTAPDLVYRFLLDKLQRALVADPGAAPLVPYAAEFSARTPAPLRPPPGFGASPSQ